MTQDQSINSSMLNSAVYQGHIRHRRFVPVEHSFRYPLFMLALDLDELPALFRQKWYMGERWFHPVRFKRSDFFAGKHDDLKQAVIENVIQSFADQNLEKPNLQRVLLVTHLRYFNFIFNPVSFYYCYDAADKLVAIQAEITNTPWKERHSYVLPVDGMLLDGKALDRKATNTRHDPYVQHAWLSKHSAQPKHEFRFAKHFHVSPFNPMNMDYRWVFSDLSDQLLVQMDNTMSKSAMQTDQAVKHFDATLTMTKHPIVSTLGRTLIQYPVMTVKVVWGIYWQAFKLFVKRSPFYSHPNHQS